MTKETNIRKIVQNYSSLLMGRTLGDLFTFIFFVVLSRTFGQEGIGNYSFAIALTGFFVVFADFGLSSLSTKEMSRGIVAISEYFGKIFCLRLILTFAITAVLSALLLFYPFPRETIVIIAIIGVYQIIYSLVDGCAAVFIAREDMHFVGAIEFLTRMAIALIGILVIKAGGGLAATLSVMPLVSLIFLVVAYLIVVKKYGKPKLILNYSIFRQLFRETIPYGLSIFLRQLATRIDVVFLWFLLGATAAGVYNVGYRIVFLLFIVPGFIGTTLFPIASRLYVNSKQELRETYQKSLNIACLIGIPAAAGLWLIAPGIINLFFGQEFVESSLILRFLAWLLLLAFFKSITGVFLTACDRQIDRTKSQLVGACANICGNAILIPTIGIKGAAIATLISETLLVIFSALKLKDLLGWPQIGSRLTMSFIATATFIFPLFLYKDPPLIIVIPLSVIIYGGILLSFKDVRKKEFPLLISLFKSCFGKQVLAR